MPEKSFSPAMGFMRFKTHTLNKYNSVVVGHDKLLFVILERKSSVRTSVTAQAGIDTAIIPIDVVSTIPNSPKDLRGLDDQDALPPLTFVLDSLLSPKRPIAYISPYPFAKTQVGYGVVSLVIIVVECLIFKWKVEESITNQLMHIELSNSSLIAQPDPEIPLIVWSGCKQHICMNIDDITVITHGIIRIALNFYPSFVHETLLP
jgi:hypothetical protein